MSLIDSSRIDEDKISHQPSSSLISLLLEYDTLNDTHISTLLEILKLHLPQMSVSSVGLEKGAIPNKSRLLLNFTPPRMPNPFQSANSLIMESQNAVKTTQEMSKLQEQLNSEINEKMRYIEINREIAHKAAELEVEVYQKNKIIDGLQKNIIEYDNSLAEKFNKHNETVKSKLEAAEKRIEVLNKEKNAFYKENSVLKEEIKELTHAKEKIQEIISECVSILISDQKAYTQKLSRLNQILEFSKIVVSQLEHNSDILSKLGEYHIDINMFSFIECIPYYISESDRIMKLCFIKEASHKSEKMGIYTQKIEKLKKVLEIIKK